MERTDITDMVQRYRLALRYIWNSCIWVDPELRDWDSVYSFRELQLPLFKALVADALQIEAKALFGPRFPVVPELEIGWSNIQVNRRLPDEPAGWLGEIIRGNFKADDIAVHLVGFFDWAPLAYIDLRYCEVAIDAFPNHPDRVGHHALVEANECRFLWAAEP